MINDIVYINVQAPEVKVRISNIICASIFLDTVKRAGPVLVLHLNKCIEFEKRINNTTKMLIFCFCNSLSMSFHFNCLGRKSLGHLKVIVWDMHGCILISPF